MLIRIHSDFRETGILVDFKNSLESSLRSQLTESALYMGECSLIVLICTMYLITPFILIGTNL